jgi:hypothetical protein
MSADGICECQCGDKRILQLKLYFMQNKNVCKIKNQTMLLR